MNHKLYVFCLFISIMMTLPGCDSSDSSNSSRPSETSVTFTSNQEASLVLGQTNFTSSGASATASNLNNPWGMPVVAEGRLYISEFGNNRIVGYNSIPTSSGQSADFVIGQNNDFTTNAVNKGLASPTASSLNGPCSMFYDGEKFYVSDYNNNRVLVYNSPPTGDTDADVVIGQPNFTSSLNGCTSASFYNPDGLFVTNGKLIIADSFNRRVLIYNTIPTTNGAAADVVVGKSDFTSDTAGCTASTISLTWGVWVHKNKLYIVDADNSRILVYNSIPTTNGASADAVLGQGDFTSNSFGTTSTTFNYPYFLCITDANQMVVSDLSNNRVLVWNSIPSDNTRPANIVLGQPDFVTSTSDCSATSLNSPAGLLLHDHKLFVVDYGNNRVMVYE